MLWGLVVGDCLGSPVQFSGKDDHPWVTEMMPCHRFCTPPGYWTDDSSMAMCIMDSYLSVGGYELRDIGMSFWEWFEDGYLAGKRTKSGPSKELKRESVPNSGWAVETLQAALWAFNTTETFEDGMISAVNLGGDADSIGAVYGQIAGAYYGFTAIPSRWVKAVKTWEKVDDFIERFVNSVLSDAGFEGESPRFSCSDLRSHF